MAVTPQLRLGLIGANISGSPSKRVFEAEASHHRLPLCYDLLDLSDPRIRGKEVGDILRWAADEGYLGLNVTHPLKSLVLPHLKYASEAVLACGACNLVELNPAGTRGHNTDWTGFAHCVTRAVPDALDDDVLLLGAGGAGSAIAYAFLSAGQGRVFVHDQRAEQAIALVSRLSDVARNRIVAVPDPAGPAGRIGGIVNATPVGSSAYPGLAVPVALIHAGLWVMDAVYAPARTPLLDLAQEKGCVTIGGHAMLAEQAAAGFRIFTGLAADGPRMLRTMAVTSETNATRCGLPVMRRAR